jgi:RNA polymerase sigma factor (sigma-70 family)
MRRCLDDSDGEMRTTRSNDAALVAAARAGDRRALDELTATYLPLVYTIVRRGLDGHPDVDDVVQEVMLRALRQLPQLRTPTTFRAWLAAIATSQVSTHLRGRARNAARTTGIEEAVGLADAHGPSEDLTVLRADLSRQRRQVERASRWLDPDDRALLSLWWLEVADQLTRAELAAALGLTVAHAGVRVQRMRAQLEASRALVAALDVRHRCPGLAAAAAGWDGTPSVLWRKRLTRHVRSCPLCSGAADGLVVTDRLLPAFALLPVPAGLGLPLLGLAFDGATAGAAPAALLGTAGSGVASTAGAGVKAGVLGQLFHTAALHPVLSTIAAGTLAAGAAVSAVQLAPSPAPAPPAAAAPTRTTAAPGTPTAAPTSSAPATVVPEPATPSASASTSPAATGTGAVALGPLSLEAQNAAGRYVAGAGDFGVLVPAGPGADGATRDRATFTAVAGLADSRCFSFRYSDGRYLRHASWRGKLDADAGTALFRGDATFCVRPGVAAGSVSLEASNYPGWFLRHRGDQLWVDQSDGSTAFRADGSFRVRPPLSR